MSKTSVVQELTNGVAALVLTTADVFCGRFPTGSWRVGREGVSTMLTCESYHLDLSIRLIGLFANISGHVGMCIMVVGDDAISQLAPCALRIYMGHVREWVDLWRKVRLVSALYMSK